MVLLRTRMFGEMLGMLRDAQTGEPGEPWSPQKVDFFLYVVNKLVRKDVGGAETGQRNARRRGSVVRLVPNADNLKELLSREEVRARWRCTGRCQRDGNEALARYPAWCG